MEIIIECTVYLKGARDPVHYLLMRTETAQNKETRIECTVYLKGARGPVHYLLSGANLLNFYQFLALPWAIHTFIQQNN
jgi:hypothetical protein